MIVLLLLFFSKNQEIDIEILENKLNDVNWNELGFVCNSRFQFSQKNVGKFFVALKLCSIYVTAIFVSCDKVYEIYDNK
ncbi:MAG: hypothetical protein Pg6B_05390 [Candidatus Azobacteroides pseudotrichonymphae]|jgi:hypothetical protein|nr:hypothetical protein [Bacteroidales bacterium OttesenSCG-928-I14]GMO35020.1 MAG: hypothetical protein Pg6B_05390 [Candidatus Azobacteroides pseudotrichonymphae]